MSLTQQDLPGMFAEYPMHANTDAAIKIILYSEFDEATRTGTVVDLTGATFKARGIDDDDVEVWSTVPTSPVPTSGEIFNTVPKATTLAKTGESGNWGLKVIWSGGDETIVAYGPFLIGPVLVN